MDPISSANLQKTELAAKAVMAKQVRTIVLRVIMVSGTKLFVYPFKIFGSYGYTKPLGLYTLEMGMQANKEGGNPTPHCPSPRFWPNMRPLWGF